MREIRKLSEEELQRAYETVFKEAFPPNELKPLRIIADSIRAGEYIACGLFEDEMAMGYICFWSDAPYVLIDYLCVPKEIRCGGIGGELIDESISCFPPDTIFIGEVEAPTGDAGKDAMILRRLKFYERHGAQTLDYDTSIFGVHYKTLVWAGERPDSAELMRRHDGLYRRQMPDAVYKNAVRIPYRPGEPAGRFEKWMQ